MQKISIVFLIFLAALTFYCQVSAQTIKNNKKKSEKPEITIETKRQETSEERKEFEKTKRMHDEASYYASVRYVIVYNFVFNERRRIQILMEPKQFNENNLTKVFDLVKKRFPSPTQLWITVHTSLATIETPEEDEMAKDSKDSRFGNIKFKYKSAFFFRYNDREEALVYTTKLSPYRDKRVVLSRAKSKQ
ncbi:MAG: hypothetical protein ACR2N3_03150 [Pyrinomonadaceae bacterium]